MDVIAVACRHLLGIFESPETENMTPKLRNGWSEGNPTEDGIYLRASDEYDDDEDGDEFHLIDGKWHRDGNPWVCYGGVWKRVADLPNA